MTLTPDLALAYLKALSADYRAGVVLGARGELLAGDERLAQAARTLLEGAPATLREGETPAGKVFAVRTATHSILVVTGPFALVRVARHDLRTALAGLGAENAQETSVHRIPLDSVAVVLAAAD